jgi:hypothetical protein
MEAKASDRGVFGPLTFLFRQEEAPADTEPATEDAA